MNDKDMVGSQNEATLPFIKMINSENKRLSLLVEQILQSASLDKKEIQLNKEKVLLNELIESIVQSAQFRMEAIDGTILLKMPSKLIYINADKLHTTNAISNLIDNAIKYSEKKPNIVVELKKAGDTIEVIVDDSGIGIKKEHQNKIFDKLYRVPTGNIHNVKGFGLGLSYVKAIAEIHEWEIKIQSKIGIGSQFKIIIKD